MDEGELLRTTEKILKKIPVYVDPYQEVITPEWRSGQEAGVMATVAFFMKKGVDVSGLTNEPLSIIEGEK